MGGGGGEGMMHTKPCPLGEYGGHAPLGNLHALKLLLGPHKCCKFETNLAIYTFPVFLELPMLYGILTMLYEKILYHVSIVTYTKVTYTRVSLSSIDGILLR